MNICVFGSSSDRIDKIYLEQAHALGCELARRGHTLVFGAGKYGIMGAAARGADSENGKIIGVTPTFFLDQNVIYDKCTQTICTETMRERKAIMEDKSDAFIICAGGMGTFEEFFEVLTLKQLRRHAKPIIVANINGYYNSLLAMMSNAVAQKFMTDDCNCLYSVADTNSQIFEQLETYVPYSYDKYEFLEWNREEKNG